MKFCSTTLGCKVNQVETEAIEGILISYGHTNVKFGEDCDVCIINTCAVTSESVRKSRQAVRRARTLMPDALIAVCGCLSQLQADVVDDLGADIVGGSGDRHGFALEICDALQRRDRKSNDDVQAMPSDGEVATDSDEDKSTISKRQKTILDNPFERQTFEDLPFGGSSGRTRAFIKIQDGCDNFCAYCVIPFARGSVRSLPVSLAAQKARQLGHQGFKEIVITGIEISSYGKDLQDNSSIVDAIREISKATPNARLRLGSLDPGIFTEEFCNDLRKIPNLCDHFHISLQSGCDETLQRMGRKYDTTTVAKSLSTLRSMFPGSGITADLITGFPGETQEEFEQTLGFVKASAFSAMHVFPFSSRPGTRAADMSGQITKAVRRARARIVIETAQSMTQDFLKSQIGRRVFVLIERKRDGVWIGHSGNYIEVALKDDGAKNTMFQVEITGLENGMAIGKIV
ncbi:MAG: tRNA (N(6)-L-threonylcarbamoyladenosine(37)-C(2))-methylthiotransferase MtaB [Oscillospiraceae bacterium]|nr:tRNA (N(6)-L-threonylcarbamoyladenosine(37)-C(2))-methylthiotransferase MtaB [Oscillospiraceae bacterium]